MSRSTYSSLFQSEMVQMLLINGPDVEVDCFVDPFRFHQHYKPIDARSRRGIFNRSPLLIAVEWKYEGVLSTLLEHKAKSKHPGLGLLLVVAARNGEE